MPDKEFPDVIPPPSVDPTELTTAALRREIFLLSEEIDRRFTQTEHELTTRLNSGYELRDEKIRALDSAIKTAIATRTVLDEEIQKRTDLQFTLIEQQRVEQKKDTKDAVDAALTAQKEAVKEQTTASERAIAKSESATNKQLEQLAVTSKTETDSLRRSIDENKERLGDLDRSLRTAIADVAATANSYGQQKQGGLDSRATIAWGLSAILALLTIAAIAIAVVR